MIFLREYGSLIAVVVSVGLIISAGNINSPPFWLGLLGWIILGTLTAIYIFARPNDSTFKGAFSLSVLGFLFLGLPLSPTAVRLLSQLIFQPSFDGLLDLLSTKVFLLSSVIGFASACASYQNKLLKMEDKLYGYKEQSEELERLRQWRLEQILKEAEDADKE